MNFFDTVSVLVTTSALFSYINYRFIHLPSTIGLMLISLVLSLAIVALGWVGIGFEDDLRIFMSGIDFNQALLHGMLSFLLFAGALHVNLNDIARQKYVITLLATLGVAVSTFVVGTAAWLVAGVVGIALPLSMWLLFGALISPTDPIAVLAILKRARIPKGLETKIAGESLFNDGIGVVFFIVLMEVATGSGSLDIFDVGELLVREIAGGVVFGLGLGGLGYFMLKDVDDYQVEILITLALVIGGYALADHLHVSGPISVVVAGLLIGNHGRLFAMSARTRRHLDSFWELLDGMLNAVLFVLIGLEVLLIDINGLYLALGAILVPVILFARLLSVGIPVVLLNRFRQFSPNAVKILTWGGLRGGISIALALSIPDGYGRPVVMTVTYIVVVFSIVVQGLTIERLAKGRM